MFDIYFGCSVVHVHVVSLCFQSHTILLIQPNSKPESRTYSDYETKDECMEGNTDCKVGLRGFWESCHTFCLLYVLFLILVFSYLFCSIFSLRNLIFAHCVCYVYVCLSVFVYGPKLVWPLLLNWLPALFNSMVISGSQFPLFFFFVFK